MRFGRLPATFGRPDVVSTATLSVEAIGEKNADRHANGLGDCDLDMRRGAIQRGKDGGRMNANLGGELPHAAVAIP